MISKDQIELAKEKLGGVAFEIMAREIPLEVIDSEKMLCKSPFKDENTASAYWYKEKNTLHCFATGLNMDFIDFSIKYHNKSFSDAVKELFDLVGIEYLPSDFSVNSSNLPKTFKVAKDEPENDRKIVNEYMSLRHISESTLDFSNVKQDASGNIAFQFKNEDGDLIQTKYRVSKHAENGDKKWFWSNSDKCAMLYGLNKINFSSPLVIVEGLVDRLSCIEAGYNNVVSIPGGAEDKNWIDFNYEILDKCKEVILWFDDDSVGQKAVKDVALRIGIYKTKIVSSDAEIKKEIKAFYSQYGRDIDKMDANNVLVTCGKDAVLKLISNAKEIENPRVQKLMSVDEIQLQDMSFSSTGIAGLDKVFYGNFINSLTIITGKTGNGKSSILNTMFVAAPLENDEKVYIYSGEIPNGILLGNILRPLASRRHILEFENPGRPNGYSVSRESSKAMKEFYMDKIFNFNDDNQFDTNSKTILTDMEYSFRRYGVTNFIIDSLLTVDCSHEDGDDKYEKQKNFVINLKKFTNKYPVKVALVAHSRKLQAGAKEISDDDIAGSSDIIKCCNRAYSVQRLYDDPDGYTTQITCIKDRETGKIDTKVKLFYDIKSFRVYTDKEELDRSYKWEKLAKITYNDGLKNKIVANRPDVSNSNVDALFSEG